MWLLKTKGSYGKLKFFYGISRWHFLIRKCISDCSGFIFLFRLPVFFFSIINKLGTHFETRFLIKSNKILLENILSVVRWAAFRTTLEANIICIIISYKFYESTVSEILAWGLSMMQLPRSVRRIVQRNLQSIDWSLHWKKTYGVVVLRKKL